MREGTNDSLGELAARRAQAFVIDPLLGFPLVLSGLSASLSGCHSLSAYASLSETPVA